MTDIQLNQEQDFVTQARMLFNQGKHEAVVQLLHKHVEKQGLDPWAYALFGYSLFQLTGRKYQDMVMQSLEVAIKAKPDQAEFYYFFATAVRYLVDLQSSARFYVTALKLNPRFGQCYMDLAMLHVVLGEAEEVSRVLKEAYQQTNDLVFIGVLLQYIYYDPESSMHEIYKYSDLYYKKHLEKFSPKKFEYDLKRYDINKPHLKIGFFSCQALTDWAGVRALCMYLDKSRFSLYGYAKAPAVKHLDPHRKNIKASYVDDIQSNCVRWQDYGDLPLDDLAKIIHDDGIDILIDLAGYTAYDSSVESPIGLAIRKPAPVLATWLASNGSTAIKEIDYFISSRYQILEGDQEFFNEKLCGLDNGLFQVQLEEVMPMPEVNTAPCLENSYITFASFHRHIKFNSDLYKVWSQILKTVPHSKLMLKYAMINDPSISECIYQRFEKHGIDRARIILDGPADKYEFYCAYHKVDIALDPFPYSGGTTAIDCLYMGVPIITNLADRTCSRVAAGMLISNGLDELVAKNEQEYINKAVELANSTERIVDYRSKLRDKIVNGKMSAKNFAADFGESLRWMWEKACKS